MKNIEAVSDNKIRDKFKFIDFKSVFPYVGLIGVIVFFQLYSGGKVITMTNLKAIVNECFFIIIGVTGYVFVMAEGNLDLSLGAIMGISCATAAIGAQIHPLLSIPFAIIPGAFLGLVNGLVHVKLKIGSLIGTVSVQFVAGGILILALDSGNLSAPFSMLRWNSMSFKLITILVVVALGYFVFNFTSYGKRCRAVGSCSEAAKQSGVKVGNVKIISFVVLGGLVGVLGFFSLIRTGTSTVTTGSELFINVLSAALLGGIPLTGGSGTKFSSVIIGSLTMAFLMNGMVLMGLSTYDKQLIKGIVFLVAIAISFDRKNMIVVK